MKKILFSAYSMEVGGIETALITLLKKIHLKYEITLVLEKREGMFLEEIPSNIKIITYKPNALKITIIRKFLNLIKQQIFKFKYKNKFDFSACYATYSYSASFIARNASKNSALWVHNDYYNFYNRDEKKYKKFFEDIKINEFKKIVFVSENDKSVFLKYFDQYKSKCIKCNNLIDYENIQKKAEEKIDDFQERKSINTFINLGRHDENQKKLSRIIHATKRLNDEGYIFRVIFVGDGKDTRAYKEIAKGIENIYFLGPKLNPYPYLAKSDCLLMSSDYEGYPVVYIESMILGKTIITTDVSDSKIDIEEKYGIVTEKSENGVYNGMKRFLEKGFKNQEFDPEKFNQDILNKLEEIFKKEDF